MTETTLYHRCPRCRRLFPLTARYFYFSRGRVTGYCREGGCHAAWYATYATTRSPRQRSARADYQRAWRRQKYAIPQERWRARPGEEA
jgi:hypothetical protein